MEGGLIVDILLVSLSILNYCLEICNLIGRASFTAILAGFSDSMIISPTCSRMPSSNSINKAKIGTELVSLESRFVV